MTQDGRRTTFDLQDFETDTEALQHASGLFRNWTTCDAIEIITGKRDPIVITREQSESVTPQQAWGQPKPT